MNSTDKDINTRIGLAWSDFEKLKSILKAPKPKTRLKMRIFNAACISILLYGCETWVLTAEQQHILDVFARTCYRIMLNIRQTDAHITNKHLYEMTGGEQPISVIIHKRQLEFVGHCLRMTTDEPANIYGYVKIFVQTDRPS